MDPETDVPKILLASFGTAYAGGIPKNIRKGVIKKPPPTPNKPDKTPTKRLKKNIKTILLSNSMTMYCLTK